MEVDIMNIREVLKKENIGKEYKVEGRTYKVVESFNGNLNLKNIATYGYIDYNGQLLGNESDDGTFPVSLAKMALIFDDLVDGNEVTGIKELETENLNNDKYYNLQGIEVAHPVKGIYIHNGKKVIVK